MKRAFALLLMTTGLCAGLGTGSAALAAGQSQPLRSAASPTYRIAPDALLTLIDDDGMRAKAAGSGRSPATTMTTNAKRMTTTKADDDCAAGAAATPQRRAPPHRRRTGFSPTAPRRW